MKAIVCSRFGAPDLLTVGEVDEPVAGDRDVVVSVEACAVNFPDVLMIDDRYQYKPGLPFVPGSEIAGVVSSVGSSVEGVAVGDRVFAMARIGGLAERVVVRASQVLRIPDGIDSIHAAAMLYAYATSQHALHDRAQLQAGETLLVLGASGGVGLAAVELGAQVGATVIAAASTPEKLQLCRQYGASHGIDYSVDDLKARVRELTDGRGVDVVYDAVGGHHAEPAVRALAWQGRYLVVGFAAGEIPRLPLNLLLLKSSSALGVFWGEFARRDPAAARANIEQLVRWWSAGTIRPHVSAVYPFEQAAAALASIADRTVVGKAVVRIGGEVARSA